MAKDKTDYTGMRFGRLVVIEKDNEGFARWKCKCDCGNYKTLLLCHLKKAKSCGCLEKENRLEFIERKTKHGQTNTILYSKYCNMKDRCYNPNYHSFDRYGGRGITVCDEWLGEHGFENFYKWAYENGYDDKKIKYEQTIDRIDINGNYEPNNCRWVDMNIQVRNKSDNVYYDFRGEHIIQSDFCRKYKIPYNQFITRRLKAGKTLEEIVAESDMLFNSDDYMTKKEAADFYNVCEQSISSWIKKGKLKANKIGLYVLIPKGQEVERRTDRDEKGRFLKGIVNR